MPVRLRLVLLVSENINMSASDVCLHTDQEIGGLYLDWIGAPVLDESGHSMEDQTPNSPLYKLDRDRQRVPDQLLVVREDLVELLGLAGPVMVSRLDTTLTQSLVLYP